MVKNFILSGLVERWGTLDPSKNPDLDDIAISYAKGTFLVACVGENILGTGALLHVNVETAQIVRMSVAQDRRRQGLGRKILHGLLTHAQTQGYRRVILETTAIWSDAIAFYQKNGFRITSIHDGDVYFVLELTFV